MVKTGVFLPNENLVNVQKQPPEVLYKKDVLENFETCNFF